MRSAVALTQAAKADDAATRVFVANTAAEDMTVLACERFAREIGGKKSAPKPEATPMEGVVPPTPAPASEASADSEPVAISPTLTTDEIRDDEAERALDETPVPVLSAPSQTPSPRATSKSKGGKPPIERPTIELGGKRAMVVEALLHFDGEAEPRIVSWR